MLVHACFYACSRVWVHVSTDVCEYEYMLMYGSVADKASSSSALHLMKQGRVSHLNTELASLLRECIDWTSWLLGLQLSQDTQPAFYMGTEDLISNLNADDASASLTETTSSHSCFFLSYAFPVSHAIVISHPIKQQSIYPHHYNNWKMTTYISTWPLEVPIPS